MSRRTAGQTARTRGSFGYGVSRGEGNDLLELSLRLRYLLFRPGPPCSMDFYTKPLSIRWSQTTGLFPPQPRTKKDGALCRVSIITVMSISYTQKSSGARAAGLALTGIGAFFVAVGLVSILAEMTTLSSYSSISGLHSLAAKWHLWSFIKGYALEFILKGAFIAVCGLVGLLRLDFVTLVPIHQRLWLPLALSMLLIIWVPVGVIGRSANVSGCLHFWLFEDAMISMRYAHNLAAGLGLVWNPGERIEGYSNFLWTLFMAVVHLLPIPTSKTSAVIILSNIGLAAASVPVLVSLVRQMGGGSLAILASIGGFILSKHIMFWTTEGVEVPLLILLTLVGMSRVIVEARSGTVRLSTYCIISIISLVRADGFVLSVLLCLVSFGLNSKRKQVLIYSAISAMIPVAHLAFRMIYYGQPLPNTAYLKVLGWDQRYTGGCHYVLGFAARYALVLVLAVIGCLLSRDKARTYIMGLVLGYASYVVWVGGDAFSGFRFLAPIVPLILLSGFLGVQSLPLKPGYRAAVCVLCIVSMPNVMSPTYLELLKPVDWELCNVRRGLLIRKNTLPSSRVADTSIGTSFYFSERPGIDILGKVDPYIARLPARCRNGAPGHNKFDLNYSLRILRPDVVICQYNFWLPKMGYNYMHPKAASDCTPVDTLLYFHPVFRKHCLANTIPLEIVPTIFLCDWSIEMTRRGKWTALEEAK